MNGDLTSQIVIISYDSHIYSMQRLEQWGSVVSTLDEVAWINGLMDDYLTCWLEVLRCVSQDSVSHVETCVIVDTLLLGILGYPGYLIWAWEIEVSLTDSVLTCELARFSWACFDVLGFAMWALERLKCLFGRIANATWDHDDTR